MDGAQARARGLTALAVNSTGNDIYVEFVAQGVFVKVTAIDSRTGVEASVMGPTGAPSSTLADAAVRKLNFVLKKRHGER